MKKIILLNRSSKREMGERYELVLKKDYLQRLVIGWKNLGERDDQLEKIQVKLLEY